MHQITMNCFLMRNSLLPYIRFMTTVSKQTPSEYCLDLVRKHDYENYLCTLLLPRRILSAGFAIRAFNVEIAQIEDQVSNNSIGAMRFDFWKQTLNLVYDEKPPRNPVALELDKVFKKHKLPKRHFKRLIDARLDKLNNSFFLDMKAVEKYSEDTTSSIYYLLLESLNVNNLDTDHAASHLGKAHGIVTLIRSIPYNAQKRLVILPQELMLKHNVSAEAVFQRKLSDDLKNIIYEVATCAKHHADMAESIRKKKPLTKEINSIFLPIHCVQTYLESLRKGDFNVFNPKVNERNNLLPLKLLWRKFII